MKPWQGEQLSRHEYKVPIWRLRALFLPPGYRPPAPLPVTPVGFLFYNMYLACFYVLAAGLLSSPELVSAVTVRHSRRSVECYFETPATSGDTCESLTSSWGIPIDLFVDINPGVTVPNSRPVHRTVSSQTRLLIRPAP